jgi:hypothetical protein
MSVNKKELQPVVVVLCSVHKQDIYFVMSQLMTLWLKVILMQFGETSAQLSL